MVHSSFVRNHCYSIFFKEKRLIFKNFYDKKDTYFTISEYLSLFFVKYIHIEIEKVRIMFTRRNVRFTIQVYEFENSDL